MNPKPYIALIAVVTLAAFGADRSLQREDIVGSWFGLRTGPLVISSSARRIEFFANGTYISQNPASRGNYFIEGNKVVIPQLSTFTLRGESLVDSAGMLIRDKQVDR